MALFPRTRSPLPTIAPWRERAEVENKVDPDVSAGLFFIALGVLGLYLGWDYAFGTTQRIGPGFMPKLLCWAMIGVGAIVTIGGLLRRQVTIMEPWASGPLAAILCAVLAFTAVLEQQGLPISVALLVLISSTAMPSPGRLETTLLTIACVSILAWLTFNNPTLKSAVDRGLPALAWLFQSPMQTLMGATAIISTGAVLLHRLISLPWRDLTEVMSTAAILSVMSVVVFTQALGLPMRVWPEWLPWN